jgi:hypothetical protein
MTGCARGAGGAARGDGGKFLETKCDEVAEVVVVVGRAGAEREGQSNNCWSNSRKTSSQ